MSSIKEQLIQRLNSKRTANIKKRREILARKGTLDVTDPSKVAKHIDELKKKKTVKKEKMLTPMEALELKRKIREAKESDKNKKALNKSTVKKSKKIKVEVKRKKKTKKVKKMIAVDMVKDNKKLPKIKKVAFYVPFSKVDEDKKLVSGIATSEAIDSYGDIVRITAIEKALPEYLEFGNIREMHGPSAVGTIKEHDLDKKKKNLHITVKVVDDAAWEKVIEGVYKGFSIGGNIIDAVFLQVEVPASVITDNDEIDEKLLKQYASGELDCEKEEDTVWVYTGGFEILELELIEISLVDRPACPEALIDSFKSRHQTFVPDRAFVMKTEKKAKKTLTKKSKLNNLAVSLQTHPSSYKKLISLAQKLTMSKKKQMAKALASVLEFLKSQGVDLTDDVLDKAGSVSINRQELRDVIDIAVEKAIEFKKDEEDEGDDDDSDSDDTDEGDSTDDEGTKPESDDDDADEGDDSDEDDDEEEEEEDDDDDKDKDKDLEKVLTNVLKPFAKGLSDLGKEVKQIKKASVATSTQRGVDIDEAGGKNTNKIFKGIFN